MISWKYKNLMNKNIGTKFSSLRKWLQMKEYLVFIKDSWSIYIDKFLSKDYFFIFMKILKRIWKHNYDHRNLTLSKY